MSAPSAFRLRDVRRKYHAGFALSIDELSVARGRVLCLLGPTGAGKSTLLRLLAGLERPDGGTIEFDGRPLDPERTPLAVLRRITLVAQHPRLLSGTVRRNVEYGLRLRHQRDGRQRVDDALDCFGLSTLARQSAATLSGGQIQLTALARALVIEPDVLLLDEPTANLDPAHVELVETVLAGYAARRPTTLVWATHNLFQARRVADDVVLFLGGRIIEARPKDEFFDHPRDPRTAAFIEGRMIY